MSRKQILDAAAQIFSQKGYHAASMQDIARAVNLQKASLYHHVSSKQEILLELLDQALDLLIERLMGVMGEQVSVDEKLRNSMRTYLQTLADNRELAAVLIIEYRSLEPKLRTQHITRRDRFEHMWRVLIQTGVEEGLFDYPNPALAARALLGTMNWMITWYSPEGSLSAVEIADQFADLFLDGLMVRIDATEYTENTEFEIH
jgi:AcrR family transcriptional regulator